MAEEKKAAKKATKATAKKPAPKKPEPEKKEMTADEALEALTKAIEEARAAGVVVKAWATVNSDEKGHTVHFGRV